MANNSPSCPKAFGIDADISNPASMARNSRMRTGDRSGSTQFVNQLVYIHTHHTANSRKAVCSAPASDRCSTSECESCVTANTNTRSKNSSTWVTCAR